MNTRLFSSPHLIVALALSPIGCGGERFDIVLSGGRVMDPASGIDAIRNVGIRDGKIVSVAERALDGATVIDVSGLVVAPGFIDLHEHGQIEEAYALMVRDGVTSAFELEVGTADVDTWYADREGGQIVNYGVSIGHIPVRMAVMGDDGEFLPSGPGGHGLATDEQVQEMARRITLGLQQGAIAVGFGMAYTPAATVDEFERMLRVASEYRASAHVHVRGGIAGLEEAIGAAARTGASLHVVHINSSGGANTTDYLARIEQARSSG